MIGMSVTHPSTTLGTDRKAFLAGHDQLMPFLLATVIFVVVSGISLWFTGLPQ
jgi:hypothetical protein